MVMKVYLPDTQSVKQQEVHQYFFPFKNEIMQKKILTYSLMLALLAGAGKARAQATGSTETASPASANTVSGGFYATGAESLYIGPGEYTLNGTWEIYSKNIYISKDASFIGTGTIKLYNASVAGGTASPTLIDGNGVNATNAIAPTIEINNASNVEQTDQPLTTEFTTAGWADVVGNAGVYAGGLVSFAVANGDWVTNAFTLTLGGAASLTGYAPDRYVVTNHNSGELVKEGIGSSYFFPIGRAEGGGPDYAPAHMAITAGGPATYHANVRNYTESASNESLLEISGYGYVERTWMVYADAAGSTADMNFIHQTGVGIDDAPYSILSSNVLRYDGAGGWVPSTNDAETAGSGFDASVPAGYWAQNKTYDIPATVGAGTFYTKASSLIILPVTLLGFDAAKSGSKAILSWQVAAETGVSSYVVERMAGSSWHAVGTVAAIGGTAYSFTDATAKEGGNYYRLRIVGTNGKVSYSVIRLLNFGSGLVIAAYPNPVSSQLSITGLANARHVELTEITGRTVLSMAANGSNTRQINTSGLPAGSYLLKVTGKNNSVTTIKIIKQ